ncbi:restriction endonuclease subunit S [Novilysobacter spongiicola]|uniref:Type I restriction enzyme, S subunit n=1 Tax=Lysobacter spongiicola DSM 21749 TaxID=1122188 RepID=A0A1T4NB31_9GAMM|nr:restriction endonuclease subunit S [Lysobacter spongiicola]SJZ76489.1 type I restriction enzyme, S subunit [Lysobacter spongiicola DSM 21749]
MSLPRYPEYKDSGVEWIGDIPSHWAATPISMLATLNDETLPESTDAELEIEYVDIGSVSLTGGIERSEALTFSNAPSRARRIVRDGDVLVSTVRTYLKAIAPVVSPAPNLIASTGFAVVRPKSGQYSGYLKYGLQCEAFVHQVIARSTGVSYPAINASDLARIPLWTPSFGEQHAIASFLDRETAKIDALIAEQEKLLALLAEKRQATISRAVTRGLDANAPMMESGTPWLGRVPAHWEVRPLKKVIASAKAGPFGSALTKDMYCASGYRVYGQEQVIPADFTLGDYFIGSEKYSELQQYAVTPGDILISCVGTFGKVAIVPEGIHPGVINPRLIRLRSRSHVLAEFLVTVLRSNIVFEQFSLLSRGGTMDVINIGTLNGIQIAVPPLSEQGAVCDFVVAECARIDRLGAEAKRSASLLRERRTALIAAAVTGQIDVRGAVEAEAA